MAEDYTVGIIVFDEVLTAEVIGPAEVFGLARKQPGLEGSRVLLIGIDPQPTIRTAEGITLTVDCTLADAPRLDVLVVPGADDVEALMTHTALNAFIQQHSESAQWVSSVCAGAFVLGSAGALDGKQATTWYGGEASLQRHFPQAQVVHDAPVVVDHRLVTANGGLVSYRAALVLLAQLTSTDVAKEVYDTLNMGRLGTWAEIEATVST